MGVRLIIHRAEPILRARVLETLQTRFHSRIDLDTLDVSVINGLQISGGGLSIYSPSDPNPYAPGALPLIHIRDFRFATALRDLFREPMRVHTVYVNGMTIEIQRNQDQKTTQSAPAPKKKQKLSIFVDEFLCRDSELLIHSRNPEKPPLKFQIGGLKMKDIGPGLPFQFDATLINPKPPGDIHSAGQFGPLDDQHPRNSPLQGTYTFNRADLSVFKGISGTLSSTGKYSGTLGDIQVDGETDTPDFMVDVSQHPVPLHTEFHAIVDGTDGDTYLEPVRASFLHTKLTASGKIVRMTNARGHDIQLHVVTNEARIQDLLLLGVRTSPPVLSGPVQMNTNLTLVPGKGDFINRVDLEGKFHISNALFSNDKIQNRIDHLSEISQGKPRQAKQPTSGFVPSDLQGTFHLQDAVLSFASLKFSVPGTHADVTGQYSLDGNLFDFHGKLKLQAKLSQMTTGWKSVLLKAVDPFFEKDGAGTEVPFKVTGTREAPQFGLDFGYKDEDKADAAPVR